MFHLIGSADLELYYMFHFDRLLRQESTDFVVDWSEVKMQSTYPLVTELYHKILNSLRIYIFKVYCNNGDESNMHLISNFI